MVDYKTRIFFENETGMLGAEVKLYAEDGENIDNIIITSESKFREVADRILEMDETYIDHEELSNLLLNVSNQLNINATSFQGMVPGDFARALHSHGDYAQINHSSPSDIYGKGTTSNYGHNKIVNNVSSNSYQDGEVLSAYQGKILNDNINTAKADVMKWEQVALSGHNNVSNYAKLYVNQALRLATVTYARSNILKGVASSKDDNNNDWNPSPYWVAGVRTLEAIYLHTEGAIPKAYAPLTSVAQAHRGNSNFVIWVNNDGAIMIHNSTGDGSKNGNGISPVMQFTYKY